MAEGKSATEYALFLLPFSVGLCTVRPYQEAGN